MTNSPIRQINKSGEVSIPPDCKEHADIKNGDYVQFEKEESGRLSIKKWVPAVIALLVLVAMWPSVSFAHAQETNSTATEPVPIQEPAPAPVQTIATPTATVESITFSGPAAYYPMRVEFTYPAGINPIWNVTKGSIMSVYSESATVGVGGITTKTWSTGMADTFTIRFGERYPVDIDQVAIVRIYGNTSNPVPEWIIPIKGDSFEREIKLVTSPMPHTPTPEELAAPVIGRLDTLTQKVDTVDFRTRQQEVTLTLTAGVLQGSLGVFILGIIAVVALVIAVFATLRHFKRSKQTLEPIGGNPAA